MEKSAISIAISRRGERLTASSAHGRLERLVDEIIDHYVSWHEECLSVDLSYENWTRASRSERNLAYSASLAALDREEHAAMTY